MKLNYRRDTDSLRIDLSRRPHARAMDVGHGVTVSLDEQGRISGIDIAGASAVVDLEQLDARDLPGTDVVLAEDDPHWQQRITAASLSNASLLAMARKSSPPASWFEESDDPFAAESSESS